MTLMLWFVTVLLTVLPLVLYLVYAMRRLETRRQLLLQTLLSLGIEGEYMKIRHGQDYSAWNQIKGDERRTRMETEYFNKDFRAETSWRDYVWPVALMTVFSGLGWVAALSHFAPDARLTPFKDLVPVTFVWGFVGAFFACVLAIIEEFRRYGLAPASYYSLAFRLMFSSTAAYLLYETLPGATPIAVAFAIGLFPMQTTWTFLTEKAAQALGAAPPERELGADLAAIQGLEDSRNRQLLTDIGITSVQRLATADPLFVFFQTTFQIRTVVDMIDKAILHLYIGDKAQQLRTHGINGVIELVALAKLIEQRAAYVDGAAATGETAFSKVFENVDAEQLLKDVAGVLGQSVNELKAFIYNLYYDPVVTFIYDVWGRYLHAKP